MYACGKFCDYVGFWQESKGATEYAMKLLSRETRFQEEKLCKHELDHYIIKLYPDHKLTKIFNVGNKMGFLHSKRSTIFGEILKKTSLPFHELTIK